MSGQPWPALIVVHEIMGLVDHIEDMARRFARHGYLALAPDLYARHSVATSLSERDIMGAIRYAGEPDLEAATASLPAAERERVRVVVTWLAHPRQLDLSARPAGCGGRAAQPARHSASGDRRHRLATLISELDTPVQLLLTAAVIFSVLPVVFYLLVQRFIVSGLTAGAVKG